MSIKQTTNVNKEIKRGDIYWFDMSLVYSGDRHSIQDGVRPVLIIQNNVGNHFSSNVIITPVTSRTKKYLPTHSEIRNEHLKYDSTVLAELIFTVPKIDLGNYVCTVSDKELNDISNALAVSLALGSAVS